MECQSAFMYQFIKWILNQRLMKQSLLLLLFLGPKNSQEDPFTERSSVNISNVGVLDDFLLLSSFVEGTGRYYRTINCKCGQYGTS